MNSKQKQSHFTDILGLLLKIGGRNIRNTETPPACNFFAMQLGLILMHIF